MRRPARTGFTLIELLVVIAIVGLLLALLVPAILRARDAAARVKCASNLRQLGLAAQHYSDIQLSLPAGMRCARGTDRFLLMSWQTQLLPFVEQDALWQAMVAAYGQSRWPLNNPPHLGLATPMRVFTCPSDPRADLIAFAPRDRVNVAFSSYLGVEGLDLVTLGGVLFRDSHVRMTDIKDGTSTTLLAGERPPSADSQFGWWYAGAGQRFTGSADMVLGVRERNVLAFSIAPCTQGVYHYGPGRLDNLCDMFHFWSLHIGGANFLCADGSVHFLAYSADAVLPALATRAGGEVVELP
jgi:prepilin-type N-terminal cleavage/methylation domain-containing protein